MSGPRLTLLIPGLFSVFRAVAPDVRLPLLERLLARSIEDAFPVVGFEETLCALFACGSEGELPVGPLRRLGDGGSPDGGWWYCADPVHFLADRDQLRLLPPGELAISAAEADELVAAFNFHFHDDGWELQALHPERWYLRAPQRQAVVTTPLRQALEKPVWASLPQGRESLRWHAFLNEAQMLFHTHPVNVKREIAGKLVINGLWPWGGGALPAPVLVFDEVWTDDPFVRGAAMRSGAIVRSVPSTPPLPEAGNGLMVVDPPGSAAAWRVWGETWWPSLHELVGKGRLDELLIMDGEGKRFHITRRSLTRWWRRRRSLGEARP